MYKQPRELDKALWQAVHDENALKVEALLQRGADPNVREGKLYWTALHQAAHKDRGVIAALLIKGGADVDAMAEAYSKLGCSEMIKYGAWTPLHEAADMGSESVVKELLAGGANKNLKMSVGLTAEDVAVAMGRQGVAKQLASAARVPAITLEQQSWKRQGRAVIAHSAVYPSMRRSITSVFNFESGQCTIITENLATGQEAVCTENMADMNMAVVQDAAKNLAAQGGDVAAARVVFPRVQHLKPLPRKSGP
ncbi:MAG: ankyrin repeat domain-containing protein [Alphaproteobacteria bacterium]|nr:ankyrin repeat domain-containing protein [Alphaproteobacteria bacterium]